VFTVRYRPVLIEVPHFASLQDNEREVCVMRSDNGIHWTEQGLSSSEEAAQRVLQTRFEGKKSVSIMRFALTGF
jgi:ankyrin